MQVDRETSINNRIIHEAEIKRQMASERSVQTDPDQDYLQLIVENQQSHKEVDQIKHDITTVLDSYDKLKSENMNLSDTINAQK